LLVSEVHVLPADPRCGGEECVRMLLAVGAVDRRQVQAGRLTPEIDDGRALFTSERGCDGAIDLDEGPERIPRNRQ